MKKKQRLNDKIADAKKRRDRMQNFDRSVIREFGGPQDLTNQQRPNLKVIKGGAER